MAVDFQPRFIQKTELKSYGLPTEDEEEDIIALVESASTLIDQHCGRQDSDGNGSFVYTTYHERINLTSGRNILRLSYRPLVAVTLSVRNELQALGDYFYNGPLEPNGVFKQGSTNPVDLSPIVSFSGRYGYKRRGDLTGVQDPNYGFSLLQVVSTFGGPPQWTPVDVNLTDWDTQSAEIWLPAGLYLTNYSEIDIRYNSGFDPRRLPSVLKQACAAVVKNALARGGDTPGLKSISGAGRIGLAFSDELIDPTTDRRLTAYKTVIAR